ncbi:MAG: glucosylceramidase [Lachnospiraceae bacterium]|nr:glucosylceramidase [Lachnospiraceae bacterium]
MKAYITNPESGKFFEDFKPVGDYYDAVRLIRVYKDIRYQTVQGFGGAFTESAGYNWSLLPEEKKKDFIKAYFSEEGLAYNLGRTHINSCDFALGNYAYLKDENEPEENFNIERDEKYIIPLIKSAMKENNINLLASPWSPPAYMKSNGEMNHGGVLKKEFYKKWAEYIRKYILEYRKRGIDIKMITLQNEPAAVQSWDSCIYTAKEEGEFVADYLGPELEKNGLSHIKIYVWDHNKEILYDRAKETMSVPGADKYISGFAFHWYTGDHFETVKATGERFSGKDLLFTEGCVEYSRFADTGEVSKAEMYAHDILGNLNAGTTGIIDWNLLLDAKGGPNHVGNFCAAPVMLTEDAKDFEKRLSYYYIGHFSKYIKAGAVRLLVSRFSDDLESTSFENPDGGLVTVILNRKDYGNAFSLNDGEKTCRFEIPAHCILTVLI